MKRRRWGVVEMYEVSLTPLIDTALVLLVIFMVTVPVMHQGISVDLPKGQVDETESQPQAMVVSVDHTGKIYLNDAATTSGQLAIELEQMLGEQSSQTVYVNADERVQYGVLFALVDQLKNLKGVDNVILSSTAASS